MKRWIAGLSAVLLLTLGLAFSPATLVAARPQATTAKQDPQTITVYVTRTGSKYHRDGCRYLSRSKIPMSLAEAAKRFAPCSVCKPPVLK